MFCPLCKAEFRDGFTHCSDCHIPLVATKQEADQQTVTQVWRGGNKSEFEAVLTVLQRTQIPLVFHEHLNVRGAAKLAFLGLVIGPRRTHDTEFEIRVLENDSDRARQAIRHVRRERLKQIVRSARR
jgi:hypothetical protein